MGSKSLMFNIELLMMLHLCFIACGPTVFDEATNIYVGVDVVAKVAGEGLIDLLITDATPSSLVACQAGVVA